MKNPPSTSHASRCSATTLAWTTAAPRRVTTLPARSTAGHAGSGASRGPCAATGRIVPPRPLAGQHLELAHHVVVLVRGVVAVEDVAAREVPELVHDADLLVG